MTKVKIPMVRAAFKKPFANAMEKNGLSSDYYFKKVGLPTHPQEDPNTLLPLRPFLNLLSMVAIQEGISDFGMQVAEITPWHEIESLRPMISSSETLEDLLQGFRREIPGQRSHARFVLEHHGSESSFGYIGFELVKHHVQVELYRITNMILMVQLATGPDWFPKQVDLQMPEHNFIRSSRILSKSRIVFSQQTTRFSIPNDLLKLPVILEEIDSKNDINQVDIDLNFVGTVKQLISVFISNRNCTIDEIATAVEVSKRTLQRNLKIHGTSFSSLLAQEKFICAKNKLANSSITISDISFQLGYSDPAHFTCAFHRWSGMSPSDFRSKNR
jgi:AraC-like DNA-binding protein